jgi:hypothetical protein
MTTNEENVELPFEVTTEDKPRKSIIYYIDLIFLVIILLAVIYLWYNGHYTQKEIIEVCYGVPINGTG